MEAAIGAMAGSVGNRAKSIVAYILKGDLGVPARRFLDRGCWLGLCRLSLCVIACYRMN